jgi:ribonuclease BN (tRNA processing enzyme)
MKIHVLGYWGTYPAAGEATTGFLVETGTDKILLDCGSGVLAQLQYVCPVDQLTAAVITHHHHDHNADLGVLGYAVLLSRRSGTRKQPLPIYMLPGPQELTEELKAEPMIDLQTLTADSRIELPSAQITFAPTKHPVPCLAVRIESEGKVFAFSADSSLVPELTEIARGADLFVCEASMFDGQEEAAQQLGHLTARQAGQVAREAGAKRLAITHYPHAGDLDQLVREAEEGFGHAVVRLSTRQVLEV